MEVEYEVVGSALKGGSSELGRLNVQVQVRVGIIILFSVLFTL